MNSGKYVFSQITQFLDPQEFNRLVDLHDGNYKVQHFTCWHQLMSMIFGQLSNRDSLSDLVLCLRSQQAKAYHLGMGMGPSKSNLAKANENRSYQIFEMYAYYLISQARSISSPDFPLDIDGEVYAVDATVVDLCLSIFWWGKHRKNKAAIKINTVLDLKTNIPTFVRVTEGSIHEVKALDFIIYEEGAFYVMDKAYIDFSRLHRIETCKAYYVTRAKENFRFDRLSSAKADKSSGIKCDQVVKLRNSKVSQAYPDKIRRIKFYDNELGRDFVFITNNFELSALEIAALYKRRWDIELFFRWIKQHLKIKTFWGYSLNAVKTQVYIAVITYVLVSIVRAKLKLRITQYEILQILSVSLLCKTPLQELLRDENVFKKDDSDCNQLEMFDL
jgi:hypothetical protein